jgi:hypothetical protein
MKVFISWSGQTSHKVATVLRDWIPSVIQSVVPYVSSEDIDKGARWSTDIAGELSQSAFGLLCVTKDNVNAPWLNFEAGALGKSVDKSRVCPFLFRIKRSEVEGPILQFQSTICEKEDVLKLLKSINACCADQKIDESRLEKIFDVWWPNLKKELDTITEEKPQSETQDQKHLSPTAHIDKILEEVLELSRLNQKLLRSPEELLPPPYLDKILNRSPVREMQDFEHPIFGDLIESYIQVIRLYKVFIDSHKKVTGMEEIFDALLHMRGPIEYIAMHIHPKSRRFSSRMIEELMKM